MPSLQQETMMLLQAPWLTGAQLTVISFQIRLTDVIVRCTPVNQGACSNMIPSCCKLSIEHHARIAGAGGIATILWMAETCLAAPHVMECCTPEPLANLCMVPTTLMPACVYHRGIQSIGNSTCSNLAQWLHRELFCAVNAS